MPLHFSTEINRREMLRRCTAGFGSLGLAGMLGKDQAKAVSSFGPHFAPKAKRVIFLFMNGGPSHVDTFDPKPALKKYEDTQPTGKIYKKPNSTGFMPSPFEFKRYGQSGVAVSESLPYISQIIDECCVIRSMHTDVPNHEPALLQMHTGNVQPVRPSIGSWIQYGLGSLNDNLPGYVVLRPTNKIVVGPALWSNSFLPAQHQAASVITADMKVEKLVANVRNTNLTNRDQRKQLDLINRLNKLHLAKRDNDLELNAQIKAMETAYRMQFEAMDTFDVEQESMITREKYGSTPFANSCLLARRLVERGVRYVGVYYVNNNNQPWDTHTKHNEGHTKLCQDSDRATAALISDLKERGLLEDTLVIWGGEFGRTPYAQQKKKKDIGRDHHNTAFSMLLAGGGVKGGLTYGTSDEFGMHAQRDRLHVHDLHATILHLMGINHEKLTFRWSGRDFRLTDVHGKVAHDIIA